MVVYELISTTVDSSMKHLPLHSSHKQVKHLRQGLWPDLVELMLCKGLHFLPKVVHYSEALQQLSSPHKT